MKTVKILFVVFILFIVIIGLIFSVSALNCKIGNGRMVLRGKVGESIDKTIKVINDNNITVKIELSSSGGLGDSINVIDSNFNLEPDEEKDAKIQINVEKIGSQNGSVVVKFIPANLEDGKNGCALSSTIILIGEKGDPPPPDTDPSTDNNFKLSPLVIGLIITAIIFIVFIVLLFVYSNKKNHIYKGGVIEKRVDTIKPKKRVKQQ